MKNQTAPRVRWVYLALATFSMLGMGALYCWSVVKVPLGEQYGWNPSELSFAYSLAISFFCVGNLSTQPVNKWLGVRGTLLLCGALCGGGYLAMSLTREPALWQCYLYYSLCVGGGVGLGYNTLVSSLTNWFSDKSGISTGILMMGFGLSTLIWSNTLSFFYTHVESGWRVGYAALGIFTAFFLAAYAIVYRPAAFDEAFAPPAQTHAVSYPFPTVDYSPLQVLRRRSFWLFYLYGALAGAGGAAVVAFSYDVFLSLGATPTIAAMMVGVYSIGNGTSRVVIGFLHDRIGLRRTMLSGNIMALAGTIAMFFSVVIGSGALAAAGFCLIGTSYGFGPVTNVTFTKVYYGPKHFATNFALGNTKIMVSSFAAPLTSALLLSTGSYAAPFLLLVGFSAFAFVLNWNIRQP